MKKLFSFHSFSKIVAVIVIAGLIAGLGFQFAGPLKSVSAVLPVEWPWITIVDVDGADDEPGQKDLNFLQYYIDPGNIGMLYLNWGFDNTDWSGNNTGDGCALFDTNNNGFADYAYCSTVNGLPATLIYKQLWSCGDTKSDRCTSTNIVIPDSPETDAAMDWYVDPFSSDTNHTTGNTCKATTDPDCHTWDTRIGTRILLSDMTPADQPPRLINVCSYPSEQPNSDPSDCIFANIGSVDVAVTKTDFDYDTLNGGDTFREVGDVINYEVTVTYPTGVEGTGAIATNVVMTDTLDANVQYVADSLTIDPLGITPVCNVTSGVLTCTAATMTPDQWFTISYQATILGTVPTAGIIEVGTCDASTHTGVNTLVDPPVSGPVDICNMVNVTTTKTDVNPGNNSDSDPADVIIPTAVDLLYFEGIGGKGSVYLRWATASEIDTIGFNLYRRGRLDGTMNPINNDMVQALVPGAVEGADYTFLIEGLTEGKSYYFWLEDVDMYGVSTLHGPIYVKARKSDWRLNQYLDSIN